MRRDELTGARFGRLSVEGLSGIVVTPGGTHRTAWTCRCDCGSVAIVRGLDLKQGKVVSCGCFRVETTARRARTHGHTTGRRASVEYRAWSGAKHRCGDPSDEAFANYGGRGIEMCARWRDDFATFIADMGPRPRGCSLDRINNDGHYAPDNCRWATRQQQNSNQRRSRFVIYKGERLTVAEASRRAGVDAFSVYSRLNRGWTIERALGVQ